MTDRESLEFDARMELVLESEAKKAKPPAALTMADLLPDQVTLVPRDADLANHSGYEEIPE